MRYYSKSFPSLDEFARFLESGTIQPLFDRGEKTASVAGSASWSGTKDFAESNDLLRFGDREHARLLVGGVSVPGAVTESIRARRVRCVAGSSVNVAAALAGRPKSMYKIVRKKVAAKVVNVCYDVCVGSNIKPGEMSAAAVKMANVILSLERAGYQVNLYAAACTTAGNEAAGCFIRIKSAGQYCDVSRLAYCLVHPSFLRRSSFRFLEVLPGLSESRWIPGYGSANLDRAIVRELAAAAGISAGRSFNFYDVCRMDEAAIAAAVLAA